MVEVEWSKIITNTVSVVVAAIVLGAVTVVWTEATSIDTKIKEAQVKTDASREILMLEIINLRKDTAELTRLIEGHHKVLESKSSEKELSKLETLLHPSRPTGEYEKTEGKKLEKFTTKETDLRRIQDTYQQAVQRRIPARAH